MITDCQGNKTYIGAVLATRERNYYDDSDFYAIVWDDEKGVLKSVEYGTTRFAGSGYADVDATADVLAKVKAYLIPRLAKQALDEDKARYEKQVMEFKAFHTGTIVKVIRDIKSKKQGLIPAGFTGILVWQGAPFHHNGPIRYGVKNVENGQCFFVDATNIVYAGAEPTDDDIRPATMDYDGVLKNVTKFVEGIPEKSLAYKLGTLHAATNYTHGCVVV